MVLGEGGGVKRQIRGDAVTEVLIRDPAIVPWYGRIHKRGGEGGGYSRNVGPETTRGGSYASVALRRYILREKNNLQDWKEL